MTKLTWQYVRDKLRARILGRDYPPGYKLPKDSEIADELGCSRLTIQRAMNDLAETGLVTRRRKGGTQVTRFPVTKVMVEIPLIKAEIEIRGAIYGHRLLSAVIETAPKSISNLANGRTELFHIETIHLADGKPYVFEDRWISLDTVPEITDIDLDKISANQWLIENKPYSQCEMNFFAVTARELSIHLECKVDDALLASTRSTYIDDLHITTVQSFFMPGYTFLSSTVRR